MKIIAIDPATQLGWAYKESKKKPKYGTESFHNSQWDGSGMRFLKFRNWFENLVEPGDVVAYEAVEMHSSTYAAHQYAGWVTAMQAVCEHYEVPYTGYPVGTIKKYWTGKGSAGKDAMILEAQKRGYNPKTSDEADALAILHLAIEDLQLDV
jgi:Holliday junction resolvasome RuvABC endonuclease subunit